MKSNNNYSPIKETENGMSDSNNENEDIKSDGEGRYEDENANNKYDERSFS